MCNCSYTRTFFISSYPNLFIYEQFSKFIKIQQVEFFYFYFFSFSLSHFLLLFFCISNIAKCSTVHFASQSTVPCGACSHTFLYDLVYEGRALLSPRWRSQLTPFKSSCVRAGFASSHPARLGHTARALYTCGAGAGSWAELPP